MTQAYVGSLPNDTQVIDSCVSLGHDSTRTPFQQMVLVDRVGPEDWRTRRRRVERGLEEASLGCPVPGPPSWRSRALRLHRAAILPPVALSAWQPSLPQLIESTQKFTGSLSRHTHPCPTLNKNWQVRKYVLPCHLFDSQVCEKCEGKKLRSAHDSPEATRWWC